LSNWDYFIIKMNLCQDDPLPTTVEGLTEKMGGEVPVAVVESLLYDALVPLGLAQVKWLPGWIEARRGEGRQSEAFGFPGRVFLLKGALVNRP
jgi:hypothetical protein